MSKSKTRSPRTLVQSVVMIERAFFRVAFDIARGIESACVMMTFDLRNDDDRAMTCDVIAELAHVDAELVALIARAAIMTAVDRDSDNAEETLERAAELALAAVHRLELVSEAAGIPKL